MKNLINWQRVLLICSLLSTSFLYTGCDDEEGNPLPTDIAIGFTKTSNTVLENAGATTVTISFEAAAPTSGNIIVTVNNQTATSSDYTTAPAVSGNQITVPVSEGDQAVSFTVTPTDNSLLDGERTVDFVLSTAANGLNLGDVSVKQSFTISDDETAKTATFANTALEVAEDNASGVTVNLSFSGAVPGDGSVKITPVSTTNVSSGDYTTSPAAVGDFITVNVPSGSTSASFTFIMNDNSTVDVLERKITFRISEVSDNLEIGTDTDVEITITDDESVVDDITIAELRAMYTGTALDITDNKQITGVITSTNDNLTRRGAFIQDASGAIQLFFDNNNTLLLGDEVTISLKDTKLSEFNSFLQVTLDNAKATKVGTGTLPTPTVITIAQLNANSTYQSMLVKIEGVTFDDANGTNTFRGTRKFSDASNSANFRTESYAPFEGDVIPSGNVDVVGIASSFSGTAQIVPRAASDVTTAGAGGGGGTDFTVTFDLNDCSSSLSSPFFSVTETGTNPQDWSCTTFGNGSSNGIEHNAFRSGSSDLTDSWLILDINAVTSGSGVLSSADITNFTVDLETQSFFSGSGAISMWYSTDYAGSGDPSAATWTEVTAFSAALPAAGSRTWTSITGLDLSGATGSAKGYIAIRHQGGQDGDASSWTLDNIVLKGKQ